jgi:hypothetical protein
MTTMLLGGLWHGAGWTFVIWGGLHGVYLMFFHAWRRFADRLMPPSRSWVATAIAPLAWTVTFVAVVVAWVFFRAESLDAAMSMLRGMAGMNGALLPDQIIDLVPALGHVAAGVGKVPHLADGTVMGCVEMSVMLALGMGLVLFAPTLPQMSQRLRWWLVVPCAALALQRVLYGESSEFLYYQF